MKEMKERTALGEAILKHWREHCPQMVRDLEKENRLDQAVFEAQERTGDLLYELVSVKKMDYQAAWELATRGVGVAPEREREPTADHPPSGTSSREAQVREIQVSDIDRKPRRPPPRDFRINEAHRIGQGGLKEKARDNIAAIRTLRLVEDESREANRSREGCPRPLQRLGRPVECLPSVSPQRLGRDRPRGARSS